MDLIGSRMIQIIVPVTLCSLYTGLLVRILEWNVLGTPVIVQKTQSGLGFVDGEDLLSSLVNNVITVIIFVALIVMVTLVILLALYMQWHSCLGYYFYLPSILIMAVISPIYFGELLMSLNWFGIDIITVAFITWNFTLVGMSAIFSLYVPGPIYLQNFYLIHNSAMLALVVITFLPGWAPFILMLFLILWDMFAVLTPYGPLNMIINMAEEGGITEMPGLIYTTNAIQSDDNSDKIAKKASENPEVSQILTSKVIKTIESDADWVKSSQSSTPGSKIVSARTVENREHLDSAKTTISETNTKRSNTSFSEERGFNIGLGDFIFYGVLVGLTCKGRSQEDFYSLVAVLNAILVGLILTLMVLVTTKRSLPALPISISLGLAVFLITFMFVPKLSNELSNKQIFI